MTTLIFIVLLCTAFIAIGCFARLAEIKDEVQRTNEYLNGSNYALKELRNEHREYRTKALAAVANLDNNLRQTREDMNQGTATLIQLFSDITAEPAPNEEPEPAPQEPSGHDGTAPDEEPEPAPNEKPEPEELDF